MATGEDHFAGCEREGCSKTPSGKAKLSEGEPPNRESQEDIHVLDSRLFNGVPVFIIFGLKPGSCKSFHPL